MRSLLHKGEDWKSYQLITRCTSMIYAWPPHFLIVYNLGGRNHPILQLLVLLLCWWHSTVISPGPHFGLHMPHRHLNLVEGSPSPTQPVKNSVMSFCPPDKCQCSVHHYQAQEIIATATNFYFRGQIWWPVSLTNFIPTWQIRSQKESGYTCQNYIWLTLFYSKLSAVDI